MIRTTLLTLLLSIAMTSQTQDDLFTGRRDVCGQLANAQ